MILNKENFLNPKDKPTEMVLCDSFHETFEDVDFIESKKIYRTNKYGKQEWSLPIDETIGILCTKEAIEMLKNSEYIQENFEMDITKYADGYYSVYFDRKQTTANRKEGK